MMVMCQLPVYIKLMEATCLMSEPIKFFCSEHIKYLKSPSQETENSGISRNGFHFICQMVNKQTFGSLQSWK